MRQPATTKSRFIAGIKLLILIGIVIWLISTFPKKDWDALVQQPKNWWLLTQAFAVVLVAHLISYLRWQVLVQALDVPFRLPQAIRLGFLGTLLNLVSVGSVGGDLFKAIEAARNAEKKRAEVVTSVLVDRALGLLGLVIVVSLSLSLASNLSIRMSWIRAGAILLSVLGLAGLTSIVAFGHLVPIKWINKIPAVGHVLHRVVHACIVFQGRPRLVAELIGSSLVVHVCLTLGCALISNGLYANPPSVAQHFMTIPPAMAAATLPLTPGGVGVQEMAIQTLFLELRDVPEEFSALIMAGVFRVMLIGIAMIGAVYYFAGRSS